MYFTNIFKNFRFDQNEEVQKKLHEQIDKIYNDGQFFYFGTKENRDKPI